MQDSPEPLKPSRNPVDGWKLAEYVSVGGTALGTLIAAWYQPVLYALTPLSAALLFNLVNRQRFEQDMRQSLDAAITDVHGVVESLHEQLQTLPPESNELDPITDVLTELQRVTQRLEKNALRQEDWEVMNVRFQLMQEAIDKLKTSTQTSTPHWEGQEHQSLTTALEAWVSQSVADSATIHTQIDQLSQQVNTLQTEQKTLIKPYLKRLVRAVQALKNS
ncbi:hypothetical protein PCC9214_01780 [Planktothrix tepida]|uniref:Uncharacterized protein n=2 Tax=Planktothrix TaxID=54304 RepID=A0A1J1LMM7_9CYAN|nr:MULTISPECIES: hypothetical protein [Planktothrix]CAD5938771.1 hypothetical protein PCC9214_01780 [Planktothrix tepida]CAD5973013.1 hypothetical protein NO713_03957 [Planktothrix pseudagardhii]CUR33258.1 conserved hypothetical protein [Planktothrix tepida PCC 9214]